MLRVAKIVSDFRNPMFKSTKSEIMEMGNLLFLVILRHINVCFREKSPRPTSVLLMSFVVHTSLFYVYTTRSGCGLISNENPEGLCLVAGGVTLHKKLSS